MYLRHTTAKKNGKHYTYWRLVRSVRCGRKVRQPSIFDDDLPDEQGAGVSFWYPLVRQR